MSIARVGSQVATGKAGSSTSVVVSAPANVTAGNLLVVLVETATPINNEPPAAGGLTKTAGTATLGTISLDSVATQDVTPWGYIHSAIYSIKITGSGSLTLTMEVAQTGSWLDATLSEYSASNGWNATAANRLEDSNTGSGESTSPATGSATSAGGALFAGSLNTDFATTTTITENGSWSLLDELEDPTTYQTFSAIDRIVSTGTSSTASWTLGTSRQWSCALAVYHEEEGTVSRNPVSMGFELR